jgi:hypothetical protein
MSVDFYKYKGNPFVYQQILREAARAGEKFRTGA